MLFAKLLSLGTTIPISASYSLFIMEPRDDVKVIRERFVFEARVRKFPVAII